MEKKTITTQSDTLEIEEMRVQMAAMKSKLDEQEIINRQLIRHTMKSRLSWINSYVIAETVAVPLVLIAFLLFDAYIIPVSPWLTAYTTLILIGNVVYDWRFSRMKDSSLLQGDLEDLRKNLAGRKRRILWENIVSLAVIAVWAAWILLTVYDFMLTLDHDSELYSLIMAGVVGGVVGGVIGLIAGLWMNRKAGRDYGRVIAQIDELEKDLS